MKKILLIAFTGIISSLGIAQTIATNFNVKDCSGASHDLFTDLNSGKVVAIAFVMPCGSCIGPSLSAYNEVKNFATSNPGRVVFYLADDDGGTNCTTLTSWANTNGITGIPVISNTAVKEADYGSGGMPKIIVIAGTKHEVIFTQNGGLNVTNFDNAIKQGLATGIIENSKADFNLHLFPNPSTTGKTTITYTIPESSDVTFEVYNTLGVRVKNSNLEKQVAGQHETQIDLESLSNGAYFIRLKIGESAQIVKFTISH